MPSSRRLTIPDTVLEGTTPILLADFVDETGAILSTLTTARARILDQASGTVVREWVSLLSDGLNVVANGKLSWPLTTQDTSFVSASSRSEVRLILFEWTWLGGERRQRQEVTLTIVDTAPA